MSEKYNTFVMVDTHKPSGQWTVKSDINPQMDGFHDLLPKYNVALNTANHLNQKDREVADKFGITVQEIQEHRAEMRTGLAKSPFPDKYPNA